METVVCNLCGSARSRPMFELQDWLLERPQVKARLVQCADCGLIYQNPRPTPNEIGEHYPSDYEPYHGETKNSSWLMKKAIEYGLTRRARLVTGLRPAGLLLDVGCASGDFLAYIRDRFGWQVQGVEMSEYAARQARERHHLNVFTGTLEQAALPDNHFDAVTLWDVLEHLHDPAAALCEIRRILKPGGLLALRVPNANSLDARIFGRYWSGLDAPRHLYVFSKASLKAMLARQGFEVLTMNSRYGSYLAFVLSLRFAMVDRKVRPGSRSFILGLLAHPAGRLLFAPAFYIYSMFQQSTQMSVVARVTK